MALLISLCTRVLIFDTLGQYQLRGYARFHQPGALRAYLRQHLTGPLRVLYQPISGELAEHFAAVCQLVIAAGPHGGMIFAIDEIDAFCSATWLPPGLNDLVNYGRHRKVSMVATSRRPADVARKFTAQCHELRIFRTTEPRDLNYFAQTIGHHNSALLSDLKEYEYLRWNDNGDAPVIEGGAS